MARQAAIPAYSFREGGRTTVKLLAFWGCWAFLAFAVTQEAPWWLYPPLLFAALAMSWVVIRNPVHGIDLTDTDLTIVSPSGGKTVRLGDIGYVAIEQWTDSTEVTIHLRDGSATRLFGGGQPPHAVLRRELERRGVQVK